MTSKHGKLILCLVVLLPSYTGFAQQISIQRGDLQALIGQTASQSEFESDPGQETAIEVLADNTGPNATWDFTSIAFTEAEDSPFTANYVSLPADLPASNDPRVADATYAMQLYLSSGSTDDQSVFYRRLTDTEHLSYGWYSETTEGDFDLLYDQALLEHPLPLDYEDTWEGMTGYQRSVEGNDIDVSIETVGSVNGWGTLQLPGLPPISVLRIDEVRTQTETIMGFPPVEFETRTISFIPEGLSPLASIVIYTHPFIGQQTSASYSIIDTGGATAVERLEGSVPEGFVLHANYPNPFNPQTTIRFDTAARSFVRLSVFDALGREVDVLIADELDAGSYLYRWDASNRPSGLYLYRLAAGNARFSGLMTLIK